jgi:hypothetical protein
MRGNQEFRGGLLIFMAFDARKMGFVHALNFLENSEKVRGLFGWQAQCIHPGYERALSGELPFAFPNMPSDHLKFGFSRAHKGA